jgi:2-hydroxychromene-2-carboxylate isomerase
MAQLTFWFDFASTYSYLSAARIGAAAAGRGIEISWQPFLLGPIFRAQGWDTSPFNLYPAKGRYMWRDMDREARRLSLPPVARPRPFPQNSLLAARTALVGLEADWGAAFCRRVFDAEFAVGRSIEDPVMLSELLKEFGIPPATVLEQAGSDLIKARLRKATGTAEEIGIFGCWSSIVSRTPRTACARTSAGASSRTRPTRTLLYPVCVCTSAATARRLRIHSASSSAEFGP